MGDPSEEQQSEIEALQAIYADDFKVVDTNPTRFQLNLSNNGCVMHLIVEYTSKYPQTKPNVSVNPISGVTKQQSDRLTKSLLKTVEENVGTVMVFTLAQTVLDFLETLNTGDEEEEETGTGLQKPVINTAAAIRHGTSVTRENFFEWKKNFDTERAKSREEFMKEREREMELKKDRLTGRQFFNKMASNIDWDLFNPDEELDDMEFESDEEA
eukprot:NODE_7518_length_769_cov_29.532508_g6907_i0.p1 GENE.NODE_7518_length_769_cov_29.532508_g6907_i0~~NODE_7518_length_769_cov_29.532508_g6907_i0.p1  ORF type:complete len:213 (+),score=64.43 NODE_7518_length_769_cov_29.532508_g6907_i0:74-712(+)